MYLGAPYGALWKSSDNGYSWVTASADQLPNPGVADLVIVPGRSGIRFLLTGDPDCILDPNEPALGSESCQSRGIVKSTDGGKTWTDTSIGAWYDRNGKVLDNFWNFPSRKVARKLLLHPRNHRVMWTVVHGYSYATKSFDGMIFRTEDGGQSWRNTLFVQDGLLKDIEQDPADPDVLYAGGRTVYRSRDAGRSWQSLQSLGLPADSSVKRCEVAVRPAREGGVFVYVILKHSRSAQLYVQRNSESKFELVCSTAESPEWRTALAVHPFNSNLVFLSSGNKVHRLVQELGIWKSKFSGGGIHDDVHDLTFDPTGEWIYASTDGGLYASRDSGNTWENRSKGLNVAECWGVAVAESDTLHILAGLQDCGTILYNDIQSENPGWYIVRGGDGMQPWIHPLQADYFVANDGNNNLISSSPDGGKNWNTNLSPTRTQRGMYVRPFVVCPRRSHVWYTGYHDLFTTVNYGKDWKQVPVSPLPPGGDKIVAIAVSASDTATLYVAYSNPSWQDVSANKLFVSRDAGQNWKDISAGLRAVSWAQITSLAVHPGNPEHVFVGFRGGLDIKIMQHRTAGSSGGKWEDVSNGLPDDADINCLIVDDAEEPDLYAGTHVGIFRKRNSSSDWEDFNENLPRVMVSGLAYQRKNKILVAGTHGRGVWWRRTIQN